MPRNTRSVAITYAFVLVLWACGGDSRPGDDDAGTDSTDTESRDGGDDSATGDAGHDMTDSEDGGGSDVLDISEPTPPSSVCVDRIDPLTRVPPAGLQARFRVLTCDGDPIRSLRPDDVTVINDETGSQFGSGGEGDAVSDVGENSDIDLYTVLALDMSSSIFYADAVDDVVDAALAFVDAAVTTPPEHLKHRVAVYAFGRPDALELVRDFTRDDSELISALEALRVSSERGTTDLYGAYVAAIEKASQGDGDGLVERFVVLLTDGTHEAGDDVALREQALQARDEGGVEVFAIGIAGDYDACRLEELAHNGDARSRACREGETCDSLNPPPQSCAHFFPEVSTADLADVFGVIARRIEGIARSNYVIGVCTPVALGEEASLTVEVDVDGVRDTFDRSYNPTPFDGNTNACDANQLQAATLFCPPPWNLEDSWQIASAEACFSAWQACLEDPPGGDFPEGRGVCNDRYRSCTGNGQICELDCTSVLGVAPIAIEREFSAHLEAGYLYLDHNGVSEIWDLTDPSAPRPLETRYEAHTLPATRNGLLYACDGELAVWDVSDPTSPVRLSRTRDAREEQCSTDYEACTADPPEGGEEECDRVLVECHDGNTVCGSSVLGFDGSTVYCGGRDCVTAVDVSDPERPLSIGRVDYNDFGFSGGASSSDVSGDLLVFVSNISTRYGLFLVDISDWGDISFAPMFSTLPERPYVVFLEGDLAYVIGRRLTVVDLAEPVTPVVLASTEDFLPEPLDPYGDSTAHSAWARLHRDRLLIKQLTLSDEAFLFTVDLSDSLAPLPRRHARAPDLGFAVDGDLAVEFHSNRWEPTLEVVDFADPFCDRHLTAGGD